MKKSTVIQKDSHYRTIGLKGVYRIKWKEKEINNLLTTANPRIFQYKNGNTWKKLSSGALNCFNEKNGTDFKDGYIPAYHTSLYCCSYQPAPMICEFHRKKLKKYKKERIR